MEFELSVDSLYKFRGDYYRVQRVTTLSNQEFTEDDDYDETYSTTTYLDHVRFIEVQRELSVQNTKRTNLVLSCQWRVVERAFDTEQEDFVETESDVKSTTVALYRNSSSELTVEEQFCMVLIFVTHVERLHIMRDVTLTPARVDNNDVLKFKRTYSNVRANPTFTRVYAENQDDIERVITELVTEAASCMRRAVQVQEKVLLLREYQNMVENSDEYKEFVVGALDTHGWALLKDAVYPEDGLIHSEAARSFKDTLRQLEGARDDSEDEPISGPSEPRHSVGGGGKVNLLKRRLDDKYYYY